jgi:hypothetical protein
MSFIKAAEVGKKILDDYNAAMDEQDRIKQGSTVIDVVARHEKEIQELKQWVTMQKMPTKICGPNLESILNASGFYRNKEWVGLTDEEKHYSNTNDLGKSAEAWHAGVDWAEAKLKQKNRGEK